MSGGSYDYLSYKVKDMADIIKDRLISSVEDEGPIHIDGERVEANQAEAIALRTQIKELRLRFANHLELVAKAMHIIEWVDSYDCSEGDEIKPIMEVFNNLNK